MAHAWLDSGTLEWQIKQSLDDGSVTEVKCQTRFKNQKYFREGVIRKDHESYGFYWWNKKIYVKETYTQVSYEGLSEPELVLLS